MLINLIIIRNQGVVISQLKGNYIEVKYVKLIEFKVNFVLVVQDDVIEIDLVRWGIVV